MESTNVSSPLATGGAGTTFEQHVGAMFLALLLTRGIPAVFRSCQVEEVSFQTRHLGWETDDLLVICSTDNGAGHQLAIQAKRNFTVGVGSPDCVQTFQGFWKDFRNVEGFDPDKDALLLATQHSTGPLDALNGLFECARNSSSVEDFLHRLEPPRFLSKKAKDYHQVIRSIIGVSDSSEMNDMEFWRFLKAIYILYLDFASSTAQQESTVKQLLASCTSRPDAVSAAEATWSELVGIAAAGSLGAQQLRRSDLPEAMCSLYSVIQTPQTALQVLKGHSGITLNAIRSTIAGKITLPRSEVTTQAVVALAEKQVVALTGPPGSGKSALAKAVIQQQAGNHVCLSFRAEEFAESHIDRVLPNSITGEQFAVLMGAQERVLVHVESLERLLESTSRDAFIDLVSIAERYPNVRLLLTCREHSVATALDVFFGQSQLTCDVVKVPPLHEDEMEEVANRLHGLATPMSSPRLRQLLMIPYLLDMAASMGWSDQQDMPQDSKAFRKKCWSDMVRKDSLTPAGLPDRRGQALVDLSVRRARELRPFVPTDGIDAEALDGLHKDGIILKEEAGLAAPAHDVIEDWAIMHWIESLAARHEWQVRPIAEAVDQHPAIRRGFREWLEEALDGDTKKANRFVLSAYGDDLLPPHFRDDVLISMLLSHSARDFVLRQKGQLLADDARLLVRMIHLTRVACKKAPKRLDDRIVPPSVLLEPEGEAWPALLEVVADELDHLFPTHAGSVLGLLEDWSRGANTDLPTPDGAIWASQIEYRLLEQLGGYRDDGLRKRVLQTIARAPRSDEGSFIGLIEPASTRSEQYETLLEEFSELLIDGTDGFPACRDFPEQMARLVLSWCCLSEQDLKHASRIGYLPDTEHEFGLRPRLQFKFVPKSAVHGPFRPLLAYHQGIGIKLVLDLVNHAGDWYGNRRWPAAMPVPIHRITIPISGREVEQWANDYLWLAYRGMSATPNVLQCALMALEAWLLSMCEYSVNVESLLLDILRESNNVMTTAVVASVCNAHPDLCGAAAFALLKSRECIELDRWRMAKEPESNAWVAFPRSGSMHTFYNDERRRSNALPHRPHDLVALALKLQLAGKTEQVWGIIDVHLAKIPQESNRTDEDRRWLLTLHSMDTRHLEISKAVSLPENNGSQKEAGEIMAVPFNIVGMDADLQGFVDAGSRENQQSDAALSLWDWGLKQWNRDSQNKDVDSWRTFLASARNTRQRSAAPGSRGLPESGPEIVAAVCVRDHLEDVAGEDRQWCIDTLISEVGRDSDSENLTIHVSDNLLGSDRLAAYVLPKALACDPANTEILEAVARAITHASSQVSIMAAEGVAEYLEPEHRNLVLRCAGAAAMHSNLLVRNEQPPIRGGMRWLPSERHDAQNPLKQVRKAFVKGSINTEQELAELDLASGQGRYASERILPMLCRAPDLVLTRDLFTKTGQAVVDAWSAEREDPNVGRDFGFEQSTINRLADFVLTLPSSKALLYCQPFLDAVDKQPDETANFIEMLVAQEDRRSPNVTCFWDVWKDFTDRIIVALWSSKISTNRSTGVKLVDMMLFKMGWQKDQRSWLHIVGHEERVNALAAALPAVPPVLTSFVYYLSKAGEGSLPEAFVVVYDLLRAGNPTELLSDGNTVFYLESLLQRYVYGQPRRLKPYPELRRAVLTILDRLVDAGSSAAYKMRDDFVTPSASSF